MRRIYKQNHMNQVNFPLRLGRIRKALRAEFELRANDLGITAAQFQVLHRLWRGDGVLTSVLAKDISTTGSTLTGVLDRTESKGWIRREASASDRRAVEIWLTREGRELEKPLMKIVHEIGEKALSGFSENQRAQFLKALDKVAANLGSPVL